MTIGVDGNEANVDRHVGVSVYTSKLLEYFCRNASDDLRFVVYLREQPKTHMPPPNPYYTYTVIRGRIAWLKVFLSLYLFFHRDIDVYFAPAHYVPQYCPAPIVTTIHDLAYFYFPDEFLKKDFYKLKNWTREAIIASHTVIAVSKTTKKDIMEYYHTPDEKIHVVYNGFEKTASQDEKTTWKHTSDKYNVKEHKYILYVGTLQPRKDIPTLIAGFALFKNDHPEFKLIIVGKKGWLFDLQAPDRRDAAIIGKSFDEGIEQAPCLRIVPQGGVGIHRMFRKIGLGPAHSLETIALMQKADAGAFKSADIVVDILDLFRDLFRTVAVCRLDLLDFFRI
jgi:glycosyltransferase involved in cell wall biosynthesis